MLFCGEQFYAQKNVSLDIINHVDWGEFIQHDVCHKMLLNGIIIVTNYELIGWRQNSLFELIWLFAKKEKEI